MQTVSQVQVYGAGIVGAAICRPRATNSRPYDILVKLSAKFQFDEQMKTAACVMQAAVPFSVMLGQNVGGIFHSLG